MYARLLMKSAKPSTLTARSYRGAADELGAIRTRPRRAVSARGWPGGFMARMISGGGRPEGERKSGRAGRIEFLCGACQLGGGCLGGGGGVGGCLLAGGGVNGLEGGGADGVI